MSRDSCIYYRVRFKTSKLPEQEDLKQGTETEPERKKGKHILDGYYFLMTLRLPLNSIHKVGGSVKAWGI